MTFQTIPDDLAGPVRDRALEVRLARNVSEIRAAQELRYRVFYEEMGALPTPRVASLRRDQDAYDEVCDHLVVIDRSTGAVVGTYRLIRRAHAALCGGFYSAQEFDVTPVMAQPGEILELGRSCVDPAYRGRATLQLLWQGIAAYLFEHDIGLMFGCASLPGTDREAVAAQLAYLHRHHLAPPELRATALPGRLCHMRGASVVDGRALPALIKGYLRIGGRVGNGAVIDHQFRTIDVLMVVRTALVTQRYLRHYERTAEGGPTAWACA